MLFRKENSRIYLLITGLMTIFLMGIFIGNVIPLNRNAEVSQISKSLELDNAKKIDVKLLAIDNEGKGVTPTLLTEVRPGSGLVLVNINDVLAEVDAQYSARIAKQVAENLGMKSLNSTDVIFNIITHADFIGGQSAGSAMALSLISLVNNKEINKSVMITGAIDANGTILEVGEIYKKSLAAKNAGALTLLVPVNESSNLIEYNKVRKCGDVEMGAESSSRKYCETRFNERKVNIGKDLGLNVLEVANISEAMRYYFV